MTYWEMWTVFVQVAVLFGVYSIVIGQAHMLDRLKEISDETAKLLEETKGGSHILWLELHDFKKHFMIEMSDRH